MIRKYQLILVGFALSALSLPSVAQENPAVPPPAKQSAPAKAPAKKSTKPKAPAQQNATTKAPNNEAVAGAPTATASANSAEPAPQDFKSLDQDVQSLKKEVLDLNRELFVLEEELLFPANTQVAVFVSIDVGVFFGVDTLTLKIDNKEVANYLYTEREAQALLKGGVQRVYLGNLKVGEHELVAFFTGKGPHVRDYKRGTSLTFEKGVGAKYLELKITDKKVKEQPEFAVKEWE
jgi:hypothetical protein